MPPHPRDGRKLLGYLLGPHTHHHDHIRRYRHRIRRFELQFGCRTWCAHHLQHLGSPWGIGGNAPTPQGWQDTAWSPLGGAHEHHHNHIRRCRHRIRLRFGCRTVVYTSSSASRVAMGYWGQCLHTSGMAGHSLATLLDGPHSPHYGRTHPTVFELRFGCPLVRRTSSSAPRGHPEIKGTASTPRGGQGTSSFTLVYHSTTSLAVGDVHIIIVRRPEPQFEPSHTVLGAPNVVVVVCVCPPKGDQALSCHPWGVGALPPMPHGDPRC